jgi:cytochrome c553
MYKIVISLLFVFITLSSATDDSYVFEAKGAFAKELKALVEKYKKEGKVEVTVYKKSDLKETKTKTITKTILSAFTQDDAEALKYADIEVGERIYQSKCASCHGKNANDNSYANPRKLSTLKPIEIARLLKNYRDMVNFGGSTRFIMKPQADGLVSDEMQSIAVYIYSLNHDTKTTTSADSTQVEENNEAPTSYLQ